ncbi:hypothetical protein HPP92_004390 [Vanilla planifolia]|uniref:chalcone synthase n=1 Tax=Vanilla planifolia TaxID=51239 RepID=A0A835RRE1_VANPL|nr:hypothetical protein HPP92_004390 [Vanilla planifolia]
MCEGSKIRKRHLLLTEEILKEKKKLTAHMAPSLNARQDILVVEVPKLGKEAAARALKEWGQPKSRITHLIFCTSSGMDMPGADLQLVKLLDLPHTINRFMLYQQGCFAGGTTLRLAKDIAENCRGARILLVCCEIAAITFRGPSEEHLDTLVGQALFGDGAAAVIVGSDPDLTIERPLFYLMSAFQTLLPNSEGLIDGHLRETGLIIHLFREVPAVISMHMEYVMERAFGSVGISNWNSVFWAAHPGGPAILDGIEEKLGLTPEKLRLSRRILEEYGFMRSPCVLFILDELRRASVEEKKDSTGEGFEWGVLLGFGPGLSVETVVLGSVPVVHA